MGAGSASIKEAMIMQNIERFLADSLDYWEQIEEEERQEILRNVRAVRYKAGENIHNAAEDCIGMLLVLSGELRTYILSDMGKEFTLFRLGGGNVCVMTASCLLRGITFDVLVDAETDCELLMLHAATLAKLHAQNPRIENFALRMATERFSAVVGALESMLFMTLEQRLATFLMAEAEKSGATVVKLTHEQIAKYIGSAREVVSRVLKQLEKEETVSLFRGGVKILDMKALESMAEKPKAQ